MPMLDLSVAITNPYTLDSFDVHRKEQVVNEYGEACTAVVVVPGVRGVVFPEGPNDLARRARRSST